MGNLICYLQLVYIPESPAHKQNKIKLYIYIYIERERERGIAFGYCKNLL